MPETRRFGRGRWPKAQLYAIIGSYTELGRPPEWIAQKLGVSDRLVLQAVEYLFPPDPRADELDDQWNDAVA